LRPNPRAVNGDPPLAGVVLPRAVSESQKIAGLIAFYNEKVDIHVDGAVRERPVTKFS
jgi:hypothetical protein